MSRSQEIWEWIRSIAIAIVLALLVRFFVCEFFIVEGGSMYPTLEDGYRLIVDKISYRFTEPDYGDIVIFDSRIAARPFIKRVVGTGGDTVEIRDGKVYRNEILVDEPYLMGHSDHQNYGPVKIPPGNYFLMGDYRRNSKDSRDPLIGFVAGERIMGRARLVFWPPGEAKVLGDKVAAD
ncbi:MAG: signal peptidase I [Firmicutes bacterium]|nr:signal peptidase I [Bacillota bacterium]